MRPITDENSSNNGKKVTDLVSRSDRTDAKGNRARAHLEVDEGEGERLQRVVVTQEGAHPRPDSGAAGHSDSGELRTCTSLRGGGGGEPIPRRGALPPLGGAIDGNRRIPTWISRRARAWLDACVGVTGGGVCPPADAFLGCSIY